MKHLTRAHARESLADFRATAMAFGGDEKERTRWVGLNEAVAHA